MLNVMSVAFFPLVWYIIIDYNVEYSVKFSTCKSDMYTTDETMLPLPKRFEDCILWLR